MDRINVYIDSFNLYYGLKRMCSENADWSKSFHWLDFVKFFDHFKTENQNIQKVVYFTAPLPDELSRNKQSLLTLANKLINESRFEVIEGKFIDKYLRCPDCNAHFTKPEEKGTDVNICAQMIQDCALNNADVIYLVTADSDLLPPLKIINNCYTDKKIKIFFPPQRGSDDINNFVKTSNAKLVLLKKHKTRFSNSVMPDTVTKDGKSYTIPPNWKL